MKKGVVAVVVLLVAIAAGALYFSKTAEPPAPDTATPESDTTAATEPPAPSRPDENATKESADAQPQAKTEAQAEPAPPPPPPPPKDFCERDFQNVDARKADITALQAQGGLVHIFEREAQLADPYGCADFYLEHGLDIDAADPREDHDKLTGLLFAIQRNDPKMVHFMIDHNADLQKHGGSKEIRPYGFAVYLAMRNRSTNYNEVIGIVDGALTAQAAAGDTGS